MPTSSRKTILLATDQQQSVLNALDATQNHPLAYSPYGHRPPGNGLLSLLGFNGELPDSVTGHYHLGKGYRQFNPVLMRFNSPDSWSPFGDGGLNAYGYCGGDPISRVDRNGHAWRLVKLIGRKLGLRSSAKAKLAMKFNANPTKVQKSDFFPNDLYTPKNKVFNFNRSLETAKFSENTFTAKLTYTENTNELFLSRFGKKQQVFI